MVKPAKYDVLKIKKIKSISEVRACPFSEDLVAKEASSLKKIEEQEKGEGEGFSLRKEDIRIDQTETIEM